MCYSAKMAQFKGKATNSTLAAQDNVKRDCVSTSTNLTNNHLED